MEKGYKYRIYPTDEQINLIEPWDTRKQGAIPNACGVRVRPLVLCTGAVNVESRIPLRELWECQQKT